jgi:hypothetical protein
MIESGREMAVRPSSGAAEGRPCPAERREAAIEPVVELRGAHLRAVSGQVSSV